MKGLVQRGVVGEPMRLFRWCLPDVKTAAEGGPQPRSHFLLVSLIHCISTGLDSGSGRIATIIVDAVVVIIIIITILL